MASPRLAALLRFGDLFSSPNHSNTAGGGEAPEMCGASSDQPTRLPFVKRSLRVVLALAAVLIVVWTLVRQRGEPHVDTQPATAFATTRSQFVDVRAPDGAPDGQLRDAVDTPAVSDTSPAAPRATAWGRLVVVDQHERESRTADGSLVVRLADWKQSPHLVEVAVRAGMWRMELEDASQAPTTTIELSSVVVNERHMMVEAPQEKIWFNDARDLEVRARRPKRSLLRVIDATTKLDIPTVTLVRPSGYAHDQHPGHDFESRFLVRAHATPIEVDSLPRIEFVQSLQLFVGASGYAWQLVDLDLLRGGDRTVALAPGADLSLAVAGVDPNSESELRVRVAETGQTVFASTLTHDGTLELAGLPAGALTVSAEIGSGDALEPWKLAELDLELAPATKTRARLVLAAAPPYSSAPISGTIHAPSEWAISGAMLSFRSLSGAHIDRAPHGVLAECEPADSHDAGFDTFNFAVEAAPVGLCEWMLFGRADLRGEVDWELPHFSGVVNVPAAGLVGLELAVPPAANVEFELLDDETGERASDVRLSWRSARPEGVKVEHSEWAMLLSDGVHLVRAPAGDIELSTTSRSYEPYEETVRLTPGDARRVVRLRRPCSIEVRLRTLEAELALPTDWSATPAALDGKGQVRSTSRSRRSLVLRVSPPGAYEVRADPIPGYRTPPPQRVEVQRGVPASIEFVYEPERP